MSTWVLDSYGNYYGIGSAKRTTVYILKYSMEGRLRAIISYPYSSIQSVSDRATVDTEGNIYFMQFGTDAIEVIRYTFVGPK